MSTNRNTIVSTNITTNSGRTQAQRAKMPTPMTMPANALSTPAVTSTAYGSE
ncbi:hypothetical protein D3C73_1672410 [compost metagenome]